MSERNRSADEVTATIWAELHESELTLEEQAMLLDSIRYDIVRQIADKNLRNRLREGRLLEP